MEGLILSPAEQQLFSEWFSSCDVENTGKVVPARAFDLFMTSQLARETLQQISILCGATRLGHFGRSQFYIALKLIAAVQSGLPVRLESLNSGMEVPLPKLQQTKGDQGKIQNKKRAQFSNLAFSQNVNEDYLPLDKQNERPNTAQQAQQQQVSLPPPPSKENILTGQVVFRQRKRSGSSSSSTSSSSSNFSPKMSPKRTPPDSPSEQRLVSAGNTSGSAASSSSNSSSASSPASSAHSSPPDSPHMLHRSLEKQKSLPIMGVHSQGVRNEAFEEGSFKERGWASFDTETDELGVVSPQMMLVQQNIAVHQTRIVQQQQQSPAVLQQAEIIQQQSAVLQQQQQQQPATSYQQASAPAALAQQQPQQTVQQTLNQQQIFQGVGQQHLHLVEHTTTHQHTHEHCNEEVWRISEEQQEYYMNQFKILQPDIKGVIQGSTAREYFQKSKLPLPELSQIWQLSDVNKDGALSIEEFFTAMHLVVLRKHDIDLPEVLPPCLVPKMGSPATEDPFSSAPCPTTPTKPVSPAAKTPPAVQWTEQQQQQLLQQQQQQQAQQQQQWATFSDHGSPPVLPPSPSSQSPANFDFASISPDPEGKIVQPIPLRISPDGQPLPPQYTDNKDSLRPRTFSDPGTGGGIPHDDNQNDLPLSPGIKQRSLTDCDTTTPQTRDTTSPQTTDSQKPAKLPPPPAKDRRSKSVSTASKLVKKHQQAVSSSTTTTTTTTATQNLTLPPPPPPSSVKPTHVHVLSRSRPRCNDFPLPSMLFRSYSSTAAFPRKTASLDVPSSEAQEKPAPTTKMEAPPPPIPPPRKLTHARSSSLDLSKLSLTGGDSIPDGSSLDKFAPPPPRPSIPPRTTNGGKGQLQTQQSEPGILNDTKQGSGDHPDGGVQDFADFSKFETMTADSPKSGRSPDPAAHRRALSLDYRKIRSLEDCKPPPPPRPVEPAKGSTEKVDDGTQETKTQHTKRRAPSPPSVNKGRHLSGDELQSESKEDFSKERKRHASAPSVPVTQLSGPRDKKTIKASIRNTKDRNTTLLRLNSELQQELKEIMEERVALELQIEHLKPFNN
ncbi:ralBP1-associated Eps domain-containing protein 1-like [Glandiceps talaboti]